jgi:hypothetical protein
MKGRWALRTGPSPKVGSEWLRRVIRVIAHIPPRRPGRHCRRRRHKFSPRHEPGRLGVELEHSLIG